MIVDRAHPDLSSIMPLVDPVKAQAPLVNCSSAECVGQCSPELLSLLDIRDAETYCAPHGGVCTTFPLSDAVGIAGACAFNATYADGSTQVGALARGPVELGGTCVGLVMCVCSVKCIYLYYTLAINFLTPTNPPPTPTRPTTGVKLANMTWGALVFGQTPRLLQPRGGGILGLQPGSCRATELSCAPSFLDTMAAEKGLPKVMAFCGNKVCMLCVSVYECVYSCVSMNPPPPPDPSPTHPSNSHRTALSSSSAATTAGCTRPPCSTPPSSAGATNT